MTPANVVVAHDYLSQRGGAERVVLAMAGAFTGAPIITSVYDSTLTFAEFRQHDVRTMWLDRVPALRQDPRKALPLLGPAFSTHPVEADVIVASSSGWAHALGGARMPKVVYCHNPARWLYQRSDYTTDLGRAGRTALGVLGPALRRWDRRAAKTVTRYLANSSAVQRRILEVYGIHAQVLHPPTSLDASGPQEPVPGVEPGYLVTVARKRGYKNTEVACAAVAGMLGARLLVVGGLPPGDWPANVKGVTDISDAQLRWIYANAAGLIAVSYEDFGLTPVEGYAFGVPSVVLRAGGYLDSSLELVTSVFVDDLSVDGVREACQLLLAADWDRDAIREHAERFSVATFQRRLRSVVDEVLAAA